MENWNWKKEEKRAKAVGITLTLVFHGLLLFFAIITAAWTPSLEPESDMGIEMNFGMDNQGAGERQSLTEANTEDSFDEARSNPVAEQPTTQPEPVPEPSQQPVQDPVPTPVEAIDAPSEESVASSVKPEKKPVEQVEQPKQEPKPAEKPVEEPKPVINDNALLGPGNSDSPKANSNGNTTGTGDMGDETGNINADALIGKNTGKGGSSLDMPGWRWESPPVANDNSAVTGKIVFEVRIDEYGEIMDVSRVYSDIVDRSVVNAYYQAVKNLYFVQENSGASAPAVTKGRITFIITSR